MDSGVLSSALTQIELTLRGILVSRSLQFTQLKSLNELYRSMPDKRKVINWLIDTYCNSDAFRRVSELCKEIISMIDSQTLDSIDMQKVRDTHIRQYEGQISELTEKMVAAHREVIAADNRMSMYPDDEDYRNEFSRLDAEYRQILGKLQMLQQLNAELEKDLANNGSDVFIEIKFYCKEITRTIARYCRQCDKPSHSTQNSTRDAAIGSYFSMALVSEIYSGFVKVDAEDAGIFEPIAEIDFFQFINFLPSSSTVKIAEGEKQRAGVLFYRLRDRLPKSQGNPWYVAICEKLSLDRTDISKKKSSIESRYASRPNIHFTETLNEILKKFPSR